MHQQVQEAIRPQAVALGVFGAFVVVALLVLVSQALAQLLDRQNAEVAVLQAMGLTRAEAALASGVGGAMAVIGGTTLAVGGAVALSTLAPVGPRLPRHAGHPDALAPGARRPVLDLRQTIKWRSAPVAARNP